jgi:hypothetical protein
MRKKILAIVLLAAIMAMETMTVFATEGGSQSPTSKTVNIDILSNKKKNDTASFADRRGLRLARDFGVAHESDLAEKFGLFDEEKYNN